MLRCRSREPEPHSGSAAVENLPGFSGGRCPPYEKGDATVLILPARFVEDTIEMLANRASLATMAGRVHVGLFLFVVLDLRCHL